MKTAICLENLSYSYFSKELISEINKYVIESTDEICLVTFDETMPFANINTAVFTPSELDSFYDGVIISHKISHAMSILGCSNNSKKVLYLYDLDWMLEPMMFNENLILILRSEDHVSPIKNLCNREPDAIIKNFSLEKIWNSL